MEGVGKSYFGNRVLANVNFSLKKGQILGLVGENGAGKSTLMNILFGMPVIQETGGFEGKIYIDGKEVSFNSPFEALEAGVGMVHQEFSLIPGFTAAENIVLNRESTTYNVLVEAFGDRLRTLDRVEIRKRAETAIDTLNVDLHPDMCVSEMPVGHKQFTEIAREIDKKRTRLLVLDEPTAVLTETEAAILLKSMKKLADLGISIIFISHRLQEILDVCDTIIVLRDGEVVREFVPEKTDLMAIASAMVGRSIQGRSQRTQEDADRTSGEIILRVENLWVDMPGETVRDVNLEVHKGEIFGIGGLAGQGKLGIGNGIMGLYPSGGTVTFDGDVVPLNDPMAPLSLGIAAVSEDRRGVGLLLEEPIAWNIIFTALQVQNRYLRSILGGLVRIRDAAAIRDCAKHYIQALEIKCVSERQRVVELSGGNQQKICLAKAFALDPKLLFVAEPTRGIDVGAKKVVLDTLREYNRLNRATVVMISSELEELVGYADRVIVLRDRKQVAELATDALSVPAIMNAIACEA